MGVALGPLVKENAHLHEEDGSIRIAINHLVPGVEYEYRVAAFSSFGLGDWSEPSVPIRTMQTDTEAVGHLLRITGAGARDLHHHTHTHKDGLLKSYGPMATLNDISQTLEVATPEGAMDFDVWSSHWSPKKYEVHAELIYADPPTGCGELRNAPAAHGRIVVAMRGSCPLVEKVLSGQRVGAMGVIVVDDGECAGKFDQHCVPGGDKSRGEGFAQHDTPKPWAPAHIPYVMMHWEDADKLLHRLVGTEHHAGEEHMHAHLRGEEAAAASTGKSAEFEVEVDGSLPGGVPRDPSEL